MPDLGIGWTWYDWFWTIIFLGLFISLYILHKKGGDDV